MTQYDKLYGFVKEIFISALMLFGCSLSNGNSSKCISISNQECKVRPEIANGNSKETTFFPFSIKTSKCSGSFNKNINDLYSKLCILNVVKNMNVKVFNAKS